MYRLEFLIRATKKVRKNGKNMVAAETFDFLEYTHKR